jgi:cytochrome bd ubiquinol oxidase subunit II
LLQAVVFRLLVSSLAFMFWGEGLFVFPLMLLYTVTSLSVFRGKIRAAAEHY